MLKVGVLGAGHLGKIHLRLLNESKKYELIGFYDPDAIVGKKVADEFGYTYFDNMHKLMDAVDVVDIVTPTLSHFECAKKAMEKGKHIFIEKPITHTLEEADELLALEKKHKVKGQVGHVERFNPAFMSVKDKIDNPMFIEAHRLAEFNPENGCVANLTASRISLKNMRKSRFFQKDAYISVDFLEKKAEVVKMKDAPEQPGDFDMILQNAEGIKKQIYFENPEIATNNAILDELETFADAIANNSVPVVTLKQGTNALKVALRVIESF